MTKTISCWWKEIGHAISFPADNIVVEPRVVNRTFYGNTLIQSPDVQNITVEKGDLVIFLKKDYKMLNVNVKGDMYQMVAPGTFVERSNCVTTNELVIGINMSFTNCSAKSLVFQKCGVVIDATSKFASICQLDDNHVLDCQADDRGLCLV